MSNSGKELDMLRVKEVSDKVVIACEGYTMHEIMTSLANIQGHVLAEISENRPVLIVRNLNGLSNAVKTAAFRKIQFQADLSKAKH